MAAKVFSSRPRSSKVIESSIIFPQSAFAALQEKILKPYAAFALFLILLRPCATRRLWRKSFGIVTRVSKCVNSFCEKFEIFCKLCGLLRKASACYPNFCLPAILAFLMANLIFYYKIKRAVERMENPASTRKAKNLIFFEIHLTKPANNITLSTMRFFRRETAGYFR